MDSENFAAAPVEQILGRFPGVTAAAVYAVPDPVTGDQVMATLEVPGGEFDPGAFWALVEKIGQVISDIADDPAGFANQLRGRL